MSNIEEYTKNFKFMIPDFNVATWHTEIKENFVAIDALIANFVQTQQFQGAWKQVTLYNVGDLVYISDKDSVKYGGLYKVLVEHTTNADNFDTYLSQHPEYYKLQGEMGAQEAALISQDWAIKDDGKVLINNAAVDYSAKAYAVGGIGTETNNAKYFKELADEYQQLAYNYKQEAHNSEEKAEEHLEDAKDAANSAQNQAQIATEQAQNSATSAQQSDNFAQTSQSFAQKAQQSAEDAASSAAVSNPPPLLHHIWSDYLLNDIRYLRADTFSWQSGELYKSAYEHLVEVLGEEIQTTLHCWEYGATRFYTKSETPSVGDAVFYSDGSIRTYKVEGIIDSTTIRIDGERSVRNAYYDTTIIEYSNAEKIYDQSFSTFITYYQAKDGHKIVLADQEANVQAIYEETGVAWYYILDVANKRFKLPRELPITDKSKGNGITLGLTDGSRGLGLQGGSGKDWNNDLYTTGTYGKSVNTGASGTSSTTNNSLGITTDQTKSGIISHRANENGQQYLYFYVGNYTKSAIEQTAGLNAELFNEKLDKSLLVVVSELPAQPIEGVFYFVKD